MAGGPPTGLGITVYGRKGCHLCEVLEAELRLLTAKGSSFNVVDIDEDPATHDLYMLRIPVLVVNGHEVFDASKMDRDGKWKASLPRLLRRSDE